MKNLLRHLLQQPFLLAVSLAALAHSSWSFSTLFSGLEPQPQFTGDWFAWLIPGVLLAFSVDIGLLSLANQIRVGQRSRGKLAAFFVLCAAMAFLQFLFIAHHAPAVSLGAGVRSDWIPLVSLIRDASIWILPCLLPTALCLFAFSDQVVEPTPEPSTALALVSSDAGEQISIETPANEGSALDQGLHSLAVELAETITQRRDVEIECPDCEWAGAYGDARSAQNALTAHRKKHSVVVSTNGNGRH